MRAVSGRQPTYAWLARALGLDGNPLRRASDRAEAWIRVGLLAVYLIAGPMAAHAAAGWVHRSGAPERAAGAARVHAVKAVLLQPAPAIHAGAAPDPAGQVWVPARWASPGVPAGSGEVLAPRGSPAGSEVTVWLTASGQVTSPPDRGRSAGETVPAVPIGMIGLVVVGLALLAVLRLIQRFLNWRRMAAWEAAWSAIGPRWTGRRS